jgi:hypothetical protein
MVVSIQLLLSNGFCLVCIWAVESKWVVPCNHNHNHNTPTKEKCNTAETMDLNTLDVQTYEQDRRGGKTQLTAVMRCHSLDRGGFIDSLTRTNDS